mmetsp:Transcript_7461/g.10734  ORF Transcript_7461/g.10734 Transcript_7461/m.10734 type:complete len:401 (+) Transcript_7461:2-1204(+)
MDDDSEKSNERKNKNTNSSNTKPPIALRLSISVLDRLADSSLSSLRIARPSGTNIGDATAYLQEGDKKTDLVVRSEGIATSQIFKIQKGNNAASYLGTCSERLSLTTSVLEIGKRARGRLQQEQAKRRKVVQLDLQPPPAAIREKSVKKRPRTTHTDAQANSLSLQEQDFTEKENRSNVVMVTGVDFEFCTPEHVRKFFSGLRPDRIVCLPGKTTTDIYLKFESYLVALAATKRSGEYLTIGRKKYRLDVLLVQKQKANFILNNLAVDAPHKQSFMETQEDVATRLLPGITSILHTATVREIQWEPWENDGEPVMKIDHTHIDVGTRKGLRQLERFHDSLVDQWNRMEEHGTCLQMLAFDPQLVHCNSVVRLNDNACRMLLEQIDCIEDKLHRLRQESLS